MPKMWIAAPRTPNAMAIAVSEETGRRISKVLYIVVV
jgi:hypothetical protein